MSDWDWYGEEEKQSQVIPRVDALVVYPNAQGDVVIRQQGSMGEDDSVIVFPASHAATVIAAIKKAELGE